MGYGFLWMSTCLLNDDPFCGQPGAVTETYDVLETRKQYPHHGLNCSVLGTSLAGCDTSL